MELQAVLHVAVAILAALGGAGAIILGLSAWLGKLWADRLLEQQKAANAEALEAKKNELALVSQEKLEEIRLSSSRELEALKAALTRETEELSAEAQARRDYEYKARVRLYDECEPLLFQLMEASENALYRIYSLARTAKTGNLWPGTDNWLSDRAHPYYRASTIYKLLAPLATLRLMQQRLTLVDLTLVPWINEQYLLAKQVYLTFTDDFELAAQGPPLVYEPFVPDWKKKRAQDPARFWRQGVPIGILDNSVDALIATSNTVSRVKTFGEFEKELAAPGLENMLDLFLDFHPQTRPVLWRMLIAQAYLHKALIRPRLPAGQAAVAQPLQLAIPPEDRLKYFDWRQKPADAPDADVLTIPFDAVERYLDRWLAPLIEGLRGADQPAAAG